MAQTKEFLEKYLESTEGKAILTLIAYTIRKTPTEIDDKILDNADDAAEIIAEKLGEMSDIIPTDKEAKTAGVSVLESIAKLTTTKWDDRAIAMLKALI